MAKVPFSKLKCKVNEEIKTISFNDEIIEVKQYLPVQDKLSLIGRVIELAHDQDHNYSNPVKADVFRDLEIVFNYTNISFTEKQKEDIPKLYDQLTSSGLMEIIMEAIPEEERNGIDIGIYDSIESVYKYQNSVLGVLDTIKSDYSNMKLDIDNLNNTITDPEALAFVKSMLTNIN